MTNLSPLYDRLRELRFTTAGLELLLGDALPALYRAEPGALRFRLQKFEHLDQLLVRSLLLRDKLTGEELTELFGHEVIEILEEKNWLVNGRVVIDIRPHVLGGKEKWVFSDQDASMTEVTHPEGHVLGVGQASLSLMRAVPTSPVISVLDLGTGSGIQILAQSGCARTYVGTDIAPRAREFALASIGADPTIAPRFEYLEGSWFEPVAGRKFDRIIANPPFVVGTGEVGHVYRDSGLALDGASELVVTQAVEHLTLGGKAHLLGAWVHKSGESWAARVARWLPATGVRAWIIQRDWADPALYVGTWMRDEGIDPRSEHGQALAETWLSFFEGNEVEGIGFGFIHLERLADDAPSDVVAEELPQALEDFGAEVEEYFLRAGWLDNKDYQDILEANYVLRPGTAYEDVAVTAPEMGFNTVTRRITRMDGPQYVHEIDEALYSILSGLNPRGLCLGEVVSLFAYSHGLEDQEDVLLQQTARAVVDLVRHGIVLPVELVTG
ncbi:MAG: methyltransferase [Corynebacterium sp.]|nr:methyltransferase [Corynebacterium sp.]